MARRGRGAGGRGRSGRWVVGSWGGGAELRAGGGWVVVGGWSGVKGRVGGWSGGREGEWEGDDVCAQLWISRDRQSEMRFSLSVSTRNIFESRYEFEIDNNCCILSEVSLKCKLMMVYSDKWWTRK